MGVFSMLFAGIIYAWSILKAPLGAEFGWGVEELALNFTLTMCSFCLGGLLGSQLAKRFGTKITVVCAGIFAGLGLALTGTIRTDAVILLYLFYAVMAGLGIGVVYNVIISSVSAWFPDKKGFSSGCLMMGFGASTLILGNLASAMFSLEGIGWRTTYIIFGIVIGAALVVTGLVLRRPSAEDSLPEAKGSSKAVEDFEPRDYTPKEMLSRFSFWRAILSLVCLTAVGSSVISFAKDLSISVGAPDKLATTLVGVLAVCNGLGRIITGKSFDTLGRKKTMLIANVLTIFAAGVTLIAVYINSLALCIIGLCLVGMSYGSSPTVSSAFTSAFYGKEHFPTNFSIMNFNLIGASFIATAASSLLTSSGGYTLPFVLLLALAFVSLGLTLSLKRP